MTGQFTVDINHFRSIAKAQVTVNKIALVMGFNTSGKTSIFNAVAATFLGDRKVYGATAKDLGSVIPEHDDVASVALNGEKWERVGVWPGEWMETGQAPHVNEVVLGMVDPASDYEAKQWASFLRDISGADAKLAWEDIEAALPKDGDKADIDVIKKVMASGWDAAAKHCKDKAMAQQRQWKAVTGENWGKDKSEGWVCDGFAGDAPGELDQEIKKLADELAHSRSREEVAGGQIGDLKAHYDEMAAEQSGVAASIEVLRPKIAEAQTLLSHYPSSDPLECPDCSAKLELKAGKLSLHKPSQYVRGSKEHLDLISRLDAHKKHYDVLAAKNGQLVPMMEADRTMIKKLETLNDSVREASVISIELEALKRRASAAMATADATKAYDAWSWFTGAEAILLPTGLRLEATKKAIVKLRPKLKEIASYVFPECAIDIEIEGDGIGITFDGRPYKSLVWKKDPNSFKLGVQIMAQLLMADTMSPETPVLIDRFDTLTVDRRKGVLTWLVTTGRPAMVFQTMSARPEVDKIAKGGYGRTYWINDGTVEAV